MSDEDTNPGRSPIPEIPSLSPAEAAALVLAELEPMRRSLHELRSTDQKILFKLEKSQAEQLRLNARADELLDLAHGLVNTLTKQAANYVGIGVFNDLHDEVRDLAARVEKLERA